MNQMPYVRSQGEGPAVFCLHSSGSSSRQWDRLATSLADRYRVLAADLAGHGRSAPWAVGERPSLDGEVARLAPFIEDQEGGVHLVGHSYGAVVAIKLALALPGRVRSLSLYEPVMFRLLLDDLVPDPAGEAALAIGFDIREALDAGHDERAACLFVDFWSGTGAWARLDAAQREIVTARMPAVMGTFDALFRDRTRLTDLARLDVPAMLMSGSASPATGRAATERLSRLLPRTSSKVFAGEGHMGPVTSPGPVNAAIESFLSCMPGHRKPAVVRASAKAPPPWLVQAWAT